MGLFSWLAGNRKASKKAHEESQALLAQLPPIENQFETAEGRLWLADAAYVLPKDEQEVSRLDFQHFMLRAVLHSNYFAPIDQPTSILDVGCGTGRWCYEMARQFPQTRVMGCDLLEQDSIGKFSKPLNYQFVLGDVLKGLPFSADSFDFVHQRLLTGGMPTVQWPLDIQELVRLTSPGGWTELVEITSAVIKGGEASEILSSGVNAACRKRGIDPAHIPNLPQYMQKAGLSEITTRVVAIPLGNWGGRVGSMMLTNWLTLLQTFKPGVTAELGIGSDDYDQMLQQAQADWENLNACVPCYIAYGQRK